MDAKKRLERLNRRLSTIAGNITKTKSHEQKRYKTLYEKLKLERLSTQSYIEVTSSLIEQCENILECRIKNESVLEKTKLFGCF